MKSAREMFEELGFEYTKTSISTVEVDTNKNLLYQFYPFENEIIFYIVNANKNDISFTSKELKAINKQVEELRQNNET